MADKEEETPPSKSKGSGAGLASPGQPTQAPPAWRTTGSSAATSPPGLARHWIWPSGSSLRSTGSRLATTTKL